MATTLLAGIVESSQPANDVKPIKMPTLTTPWSEGDLRQFLCQDHFRDADGSSGNRPTEGSCKDEGTSAWATFRPSVARRAPSLPRVGYDYIHCAVDDHSRLAYAEIQPDETSATCAGFLLRAATAFRAHGINRIERVMTDNALAYRRGLAWREALCTLDARAVFTRRYRPQTNGKAERFNRTLLDEWAYARPFTSNTERAQALPNWLHTYNHHRSHTALGGHPPISRVNNPTGHYS
jgi:transposase InsO family protein